ncbi:hypothetical protein BZA77DRAFT_296568 [Pyronema omphalodes]|nr:hypothetical protein BZA77DRAFT_296568 [Pyronema omphalodes]
MGTVTFVSTSSLSPTYKTANEHSVIQEADNITLIDINGMKQSTVSIFFFLLLYAFPVSTNPISKTTYTVNDVVSNETIVSPETQSPQHLTYDGFTSVILGVAGLLVSVLAIVLGLKYGRMVTLVPGAMSELPNTTVSPENAFSNSLTEIPQSPSSENVSAAGHPPGSRSEDQT